MLELSELERDDLKRLGEAYTEAMAEFNSDSRTLHAPHGVFAFVHHFYHEVFTSAMHTQAAELAEAEDDHPVLIEDDEDAVPGVVINMEPMIMKSFEMMIMVGIKVGKQRLGPEKCRCFESVGDDIEAALRHLGGDVHGQG